MVAGRRDSERPPSPKSPGRPANVAAATVTWPPPRPTSPQVPHRPWDPSSYEEPDLVQDHTRLMYMVVDELVDERVGLSVALWPHADRWGRLRFVDPGGMVKVGTSRDGLRRFLRAKAGKDLNGGAGAPRIGTTFAARVKRETASALLDALRDRAGHGDVRIEDLGRHFERPVNLTEHGRLIAKLAFYGAVLSTLPSQLEKQWTLLGEDVRE
jgi:hypothetical protein